MINPPVFGAFNIANGADAEKPASPKAGDQYIATDTKILYVCYTDSIWSGLEINTILANSGLKIYDVETQLNPMINLGTISGRANTDGIVKIGEHIIIPEMPVKTYLLTFSIKTDRDSESYYMRIYYRINKGEWIQAYSGEWKKSYQVSTLELTSLNPGDVIECGVTNQYQDNHYTDGILKIEAKNVTQKMIL